jgi:hypothetical protein
MKAVLPVSNVMEDFLSLMSVNAGSNVSGRILDEESRIVSHPEIVTDDIGFAGPPQSFLEPMTA